MVAAPLTTDHLLSPVETRVKQLAAEFFQVVQKPSLLSFQVPSPLTPALPSGSRVILPSAVNTIVYLMFWGVEEVNGSPLKKVAWTSAGASGAAAAMPTPANRAHTALANRR